MGRGAAVDREAEFRNAVLKAFEKENEVHLDDLLGPLNSALEGLGAAPFDDEDAKSLLLEMEEEGMLIYAEFIIYRP